MLHDLVFLFPNLHVPAERKGKGGGAMEQRGVQRETRRMLTGPEPESAIRLYYCGSESCAPGHFFGPAVRPHYLMHVVRNGRGVYQRNGETYALSRGDAFLILPGETTKYAADEADPWDYTWVAFDGANARALLASCGFLPGRGGSLVYRSPDEAARQQLLKQTAVFEACFQDEKSGVLELLGYFYLLFACMDRRRPGQETPGPDGRPGRGEAGELSGPERYFRQAEAYLQNNFAYPVRVRQLARQLGVSRTCLYKAFRSCSGKSVQQYLQDLRLEAACRFLAETSRTVTDIAFSCGFPDAPSFCRIFRRVYGQTPLEFRRTKKAASP